MSTTVIIIGIVVCGIVSYLITHRKDKEYEDVFIDLTNKPFIVDDLLEEDNDMRALTNRIAQIEYMKLITEEDLQDEGLLKYLNKDLAYYVKLRGEREKFLENLNK